MDQISSLDRKLLALLDSAGRLSVSDLARKVRRGRDLIAYRINRAEESNILRGAEPIIDPALLGLNLYKTYLSFAQADLALKRVHDRLLKHPQVYCASRAYGRWDLIFNIAAKTPREFMKIRNEVLERDSAYLREVGSATFIEMIYFNRKYISGTPQSWTTLITSGQVELDQTARAILGEIAFDARQADSQIARKLGISPMVVRYRISQLEKLGVIKGYRARLDRSVFELSSYKLHISLTDFTDKTIQMLRQFAAEHKYISQFMLQLGTWPCEINLEAHDTKHLTEIIDELRNAMHERIGLVEVTLYDRDEFTWGFGSRRNAYSPSSGAILGAI